MASDLISKKLTTAEKTSIAIEMKKEGKTYEDVGVKIGHTRQYAYALVKKELVRLMEEVDEDALEYREIENQRLESLWTPSYEKALTGDMSAVNTCIKISERRSKLYGLDGAVKMVHSGGININLELQDCSKKEEPCNTGYATQRSLKHLPEKNE